MQRLQIWTWFAISALTSTLIAQDASTDSKADASVDGSTAPQISIKLTEVAISPEAQHNLRSDTTKAVDKLVADLQSRGLAKVIESFQLTGLDGSTAETQVGGRIPLATGTSPQRGGGNARQFTYQQVGTHFSCTPLAMGDVVLLQFQYEKSELIAADGDESTPESIVTTRVNTTVRILRNRSIVIGGQRIGPDNKPIEWKLIISAATTPD